MGSVSKIWSDSQHLREKFIHDAFITRKEIRYYSCNPFYLGFHRLVQHCSNCSYLCIALFGLCKKCSCQTRYAYSSVYVLFSSIISQSCVEWRVDMYREEHIAILRWRSQWGMESRSFDTGSSLTWLMAWGPRAKHWFSLTSVGTIHRPAGGWFYACYLVIRLQIGIASSKGDCAHSYSR